VPKFQPYQRFAGEVASLILTLVLIQQFDEIKVLENDTFVKLSLKIDQAIKEKKSINRSDAR
jgi:hypothetical protein